MATDSAALTAGVRVPRAMGFMGRGLAAAVLAAAAGWAGPAQAQDCSSVGNLKSIQAGDAVELSFRNASTEGRRLYWLDQNGERKFVALVAAGEVLRQPTTNGHVWVITDAAEQCLYAVTASAVPQTFEVGTLAQLAPPAPGVAQPIAGALPPAAEMPPVSPVEQFELSGPQRIAPRSAGTRSLNPQASGAVNLAQPSSSGRWIFVAVQDTPFVRIKSDGKNAYLSDVDGRPRATLSAADDDTSHWTFEPVDGTTYVQVRNRATDRFLMAVKGAPALLQDYPPDQETGSHWEVSPAGRAAAIAAPPPRNAAYQAYEDARDSCRAIGGYWTGSSCRSPVISQPLVCPRGWAWYPQFGECLWEGRCPPWQMGAGGTCLSDLSCKNGRVRLSARGYPVCDCPPGTRIWGRYPRMACISSLARPLPGAPAVGGQPAVIGGPGRLPVRPPAPQMIRPVNPAVVAPAAPPVNNLSNAGAQAAQQKLRADQIRLRNEQLARDRQAAAQQAAALRAAKLKAERDRAAALRKAAADKAAADRAAAAAKAKPVVVPRPIVRPVTTPAQPVVRCRPPLKPTATGGCAP
ncbi:MAG: hypothetical protein Q8M26_15790 [Pseudolabrys sp.]|nr:hypothetical protein [Pseudolabrys sp.]